jgi:hypothetical protein
MSAHSYIAKAASVLAGIQRNTARRTVKCVPFDYTSEHKFEKVEKPEDLKALHRRFRKLKKKFHKLYGRTMPRSIRIAFPGPVNMIIVETERFTWSYAGIFGAIPDILCSQEDACPDK